MFTFEIPWRSLKVPQVVERLKSVDGTICISGNMAGELEMEARTEFAFMSTTWKDLGCAQQGKKLVCMLCLTILNGDQICRSSKRSIKKSMLKSRCRFSVKSIYKPRSPTDTIVLLYDVFVRFSVTVETNNELFRYDWGKFWHACLVCRNRERLGKPQPRTISFADSENTIQITYYVPVRD